MMKLKRNRYVTSFGITLYYYLAIPQDAKAGMPLVTFLHGAGERGDGEEGLDRVLTAGTLPERIRDGIAEYPCYILIPQCPERYRWTDLTIPLHELILKIADELESDKKRITLTGLSMGGFGTWATAIAFPEVFAAIAPVCGGGQSWATDALANIPVWAFHGDCDAIVPPCLSEDMVNALNKYGGNAKLTVFHGVGHDAWKPAYGETSVIEWLLAQKKE